MGKAPERSLLSALGGTMGVGGRASQAELGWGARPVGLPLSQTSGWPSHEEGEQSRPTLWDYGKG